MRTLAPGISINLFNPPETECKVRSLRSAGFTLIEILVVSVIIGLILAAVGLNLIPDDREEVRDEAQRLALLVQSAQQEAILQGTIILVSLSANGYLFLKPDQNTGKLRPMKSDDVFRARKLSDGTEISHINIDGITVSRNPMVVLFPTGEITPFAITFSRNKARWFVEGAANGQIRPSSTDEQSI